MKLYLKGWIGIFTEAVFVGFNLGILRDSSFEA
jgi:hypothetical protein